VAALVLLPSIALAQATLTGTVKDGSGAVLPGVTVEAASPALIEKTKTAVTDGSGQYRIVDLRAGTYTMTFSLPGFNTVKRENVELSGSQVLTIGIELGVGALQETVTGHRLRRPVVDVQSARKEVVLSTDVINTIPGHAAAGALLNITPGLTVDNNGIALVADDDVLLRQWRREQRGSHVGERHDRRRARSGGVSSYVYDAVGVEEVAVRVGGGARRDRHRRPDHEPHSEVGRQPVRGHRLPEPGRRLVEGRQPDRRAARGRPDADSGHRPRARYEPVQSAVRFSKTACGSTAAIARSIRRPPSKGGRRMPNAWPGDALGLAASATDSRLVQDRQMAIGRFSGQASKSRIQVNYEYQHRCEGTPLNVEARAATKRATTGSGLGTTGSVAGIDAVGRDAATSTGRST
jgi:hypothetical protein